MRARTLLTPLALTFLLATGCAGSDSEESEAPGAEEAWGDEYGGDRFDLEEPDRTAEGKEDGFGRPGPKVAWDSGSAQVWEVKHAWGDVTPEAGMAWGANSGLNWDQKYQAWVDSLEPIEDAKGRGRTFRMTTPYGKTLPAPVLECAEVAIFMRSAFASWHGLPFFMEARDAGKPLYLGHFGFLKHDGSRFKNTASFKTRYKDFTGQWSEGQTWPTDSKLRARGLFGGGDDHEFLPAVGSKTARAGAYFDEIFLNKRVGHFMLMVLSWFGSAHLADHTNMFHIQPEAMKSGDVLLERWQKRGIGHTIPVMRVGTLADGSMEVTVATGSMPRRQPVWESGNSAGTYFKLQKSGGAGENHDGDKYAALGGGIRRWRVATARDGQYTNTFMPGDDAVWVNSRDLDAIAARVDRFGELLKELTPEERVQLALDTIASKRQHLTDFPSSCSARIAREEAFGELYEVSAQEFGKTRDEVDAEHRTLDDYVFAELVYEQSRTCCWNGSTRGMYEIVMDLNNTIVEDQASGTCNEPMVFMARDAGGNSDGYDLFREHAEKIGRGGEWVTWSQDEPCPHAPGGGDDTLQVTESKAWCALADAAAEAQAAAEAEAAHAAQFCNDTGGDAAGAKAVSVGTVADLRICDGERDFWSFTGTGPHTFTIDFEHDITDVDLKIHSAEGAQLGQSVGTSDQETIDLTLEDGQTVFIEVFSAGQVDNRYSLTITAN